MFAVVRNHRSTETSSGGVGRFLVYISVLVMIIARQRQARGGEHKRREHNGLGQLANSKVALSK